MKDVDQLAYNSINLGTSLIGAGAALVAIGIVILNWPHKKPAREEQGV